MLRLFGFELIGRWKMEDKLVTIVLSILIVICLAVLVGAIATIALIVMKFFGG